MEATVVCVDNSEWTRSGDYSPTRFQAQADAVNLLAGAKTEANAENTVGVLTMAGKTPKVLVTPTTDLGKILNSMQELRVEGECNLASSVQIAQLALKHRQNKNQRQRIVLFVGSPIEVDKAKLVKIAKKLKKNNVAVDIVSFGSDEVNNDKLDAFLAAVNSGDNSHLVTVPAGTVLADSLFGSPVFMGEGGGAYGAPAGEEGGQREGFDFGVDPNLDPELAMALRVSLEEERARQQTTEGQPAQGTSATPASAPASGTTSAPAPAQGAAAGAGSTAEPMEEDALLQEALAMSMQVDQPEGDGGLSTLADAAANEAAAAPAATQPAAVAPSRTAPAPASAHNDDDDMMEGMDDELRAALQMSLQEVQPGEQPDDTAGTAGGDQAMSDTDFMESVLRGLPGVDLDDPGVQAALLASQQPPSKEQQDKSDDKDRK